MPRFIKLSFIFLFLSTLGFASSLPAIIQGKDVLSDEQKTFKLESVNKGLVILFLSAKCPCSISHETVLKELYKEYSSQGFEFVGLNSNSDESLAEVKTHFLENPLPFPVLKDENTSLANAFGALKTPHVFILSRTGEVLYQGGVDDSQLAQTANKSYLKRALEAISKAELPDEQKTRTLGCVIRRNN